MLDSEGRLTRRGLPGRSSPVLGGICDPETMHFHNNVLVAPVPPDLRKQL